MDHLVRPEQEGLRNCQTQGFRGLEVQGTLECRGLFDGKVGRGWFR